MTRCADHTESFPLIEEYIQNEGELDDWWKEILLDLKDEIVVST